MPGGRLWLIGIPLQGDGLQAATVYLALSPAQLERRAPFGMYCIIRLHLY